MSNALLQAAKNTVTYYGRTLPGRRCLVDELNPCGGLAHWGGGPGCPLCSARAALPAPSKVARRRLIALTPAMRAPIVDVPSAKAFIAELHRLGLGYHFDDGAIECLYGNGLVKAGEAALIDGQVERCHDAWCKSGADLKHDSPIGYALVRIYAEETNGLYDRLVAKYPQLDFGFSSRDDLSLDAPAPEQLITFTGPYEDCIFDPLTNGFDQCDPKATYGIDADDAAAIVAYNRAKAG